MAGNSQLTYGQLVSRTVQASKVNFSCQDDDEDEEDDQHEDEDRKDIPDGPDDEPEDRDDREDNVCTKGLLIDGSIY